MHHNKEIIDILLNWIIPTIGFWIVALIIAVVRLHFGRIEDKNKIESLHESQDKDIQTLKEKIHDQCVRLDNIEIKNQEIFKEIDSQIKGLSHLCYEIKGLVEALKS